jgi:hypothetical protein
VAQLQFEEAGGDGTKISATSKNSTVLDGNDYPGFERSYYEQRWDIVGILPKVDVNYKPRLTIGSKRYDDLPMLRRGEFDEKKFKEQAKEEATKYAFQKTGDYEYNGWGSFSVLGQLGKWDLRPNSFPGLELSIIPFIDPLRGITEVDVNFSTMNNTHAGEVWREDMRDNDRNQRFRLEELTKNNTEEGRWGINLAQGASTSKSDRDHWMLEQMDDDDPDKDRGRIVRAQRQIAYLIHDLCDPDLTRGMDPTDIRGLRESLDEIVSWLEQLKTRFVSAE